MDVERQEFMSHSSGSYGHLSLVHRPVQEQTGQAVA